jgi:heat shock protein HtpX
MYRARVIGPEDAPELYQMVDRLRQRAGLPMPTVAVAASEQPNAFATGRSPEHAVVCVTAGILRLLPPRELEGVLAHELGHVKHRHMLVGTLAATLAGAVAMLGSVVRWGMIFGGFGGRDDRDSNPIVLLIMAVLAPIGAMIVQLAISRQNEYQADATAASITGDPLGLASALEHIEGYARQIPMQVNPAAAQLAIINPLTGRRQAFLGLFRTHPATEDRIVRLRALAGR